jgi:hypothetical protein
MTTYHELMGFINLPNGHWLKKDEEGKFMNHIQFVNMLGKKLGFTGPKDWYRISQKLIYDFGGNGLLVKYYSGSCIQFVKAMFPHYTFKDWLFVSSPRGYWNDINNVKAYVEWLYHEKKFSSVDDWYSIRTKDFLDNKGNGLLDAYDSTILNILKAVYPTVEWFPWLFNNTVGNTWKDFENHCRYVKWLEAKLGISDPSGWYNYDTRIADLNHGNGLIANYYQGVLFRLLKAVYPDYNFKMYKFKKTPDGYWADAVNIKNYLADLFEHLRYSKTHDWYNVTREDFLKFYGGGLIDRKSCYKLIMENIEYDWDESEFIKAGYSQKAISFFDRLSTAISIGIRHKLNGGEYKIPGTSYSVDGYIENYNSKKIILEYDGCCFHGCPVCYPDGSIITHFNPEKTYQDCLDYTKKRKSEIQALGYIVLNIWGCEDTPTLSLNKWFESQISTYHVSPIVVSKAEREVFVVPQRNRIEHRCEICNFTAFRESNLKKHLKTKWHIEKANKQKAETPVKSKIKSCNLCEYQTEYKSNLNRHIKSKHSSNTISHILVSI